MNFSNIYRLNEVIEGKKIKPGQIIKYYLDGDSTKGNIDFVFEKFDNGNEVKTISDGMQIVSDIIEPVQDPMFLGLAEIYKQELKAGGNWKIPYKKMINYMDNKLAEYK